MHRYALHPNKYEHHYSFMEAVPKTLYLFAASFICFYSALCMIQDIFPDWQITVTVRRQIGMLILMTTAVYEIGIRALPRCRMCCCLAVPIVYGRILYLYEREHQIDLEDGACALASQFLEKYNKHLKTSFSIWKGKPELIGMSFSFWMICIMAIVLIFVLITGWRLFLLSMPTSVLSAELMIGYVPQWKGLLLFLVGVMLVFAVGEDCGRKILKMHVDGRQRVSHSWYLRWVPVVCLAGGSVPLMILGGMVFQEPAVKLMDRAPAVQEFQRNAERNLESAARSFFTQQNENVSNRSPKYTGKEVMRVTASAQPMTDIYLKGFYGTDYKNGVWVCDRRTFEEACAEAGMEQNLAAQQLIQAQYDVFSAIPSWYIESNFSYVLEPENEEIIYTIEHTGIHDRYAYLPYVIDYEHGRNTERLVGDVTVQKGWGQKKFTFHGWNHAVDHEAVVRMTDMQEKEIFRWYDAFVQRNYMGLSDNVPGIEAYLNTLDISFRQRFTYDENGDVVFDVFSGMSVDMVIDMLRDFREQMKSYDSDYLMMNQNRLGMALYIGTILKQYQTYGLDLDAVPQGIDAVDYFLTQSHKGYCVHFASAAALMLREMGVPARYVSGYVVREEDFKYDSSSNAYEASVKDSSAHAWVEIYLSQIGWVPVDVTPGQDEQTAGTQQNAADAGWQTALDDGKQEDVNTSADEEDTNTDADTEDTNTDTDEDTNADADEDDTKTEDTEADNMEGSDGFSHNGGSYDEYWHRILSIAVSIALVVMLLLFIYFFIHYMIYRYREVLHRELTNSKYRRAVIRINKRLYRKLLICGKIRKQNITDADYEQILKASFAEIEPKVWEWYMTIVKETAFSGKELQREDAYFCYQIYSRLR